ncbi:hypothetical protein Ddye_030440 [Dipteronia dyeriana]|uniref:THUMP domain-containing protein n=1 Tax=Dipteronia dyeriana TaxID=168575 RepID=A0AAD9THD5_9ROSI|nr:hypothetical protein Ddye_030440 [Dipteronia dyeriana]
MGEKEEEEEMKPWEQHSKIISIPRFDYNAPSSILQRSHSGFLITSTIKREKSATKEAISILHQYVGPYNSDSSASLEKPNANGDTKRRKICTDELVDKCADVVESKGTKEEEAGSNFCLKRLGVLLLDRYVKDTNAERDHVMSLVKLTRSGLVLLTFPGENSPDTVNIVANICQSLDSGSLKSPLWCHRIFPIQSTCILKERDLQATVSKLVLQFVNDKQNKLSRPVKFAVGYNRRGFEETEMKVPKNTLKDSDRFALLDRNKCFSIVAAAVTDVISDSAVDLKSPELSVLVELLPLSGVPNESLVVAVSVLPKNLVSTKPRLCIRALVSETKAKNKKT